MEKIKTMLLLTLLMLFSLQAVCGQGKTYDASDIDWKLWGYRPNYWRMNFNFSQLSGNWAEFADIAIKVPGSVQMALKNAGILEDWNIGLNSAKIEWVENRHWLIGGRIPDAWLSDKPEKIVLECKGLDYQGIVMVNGKEAGRFDNTFLPYTFDISAFLQESANTIVFVFECPPRYIGQIGWTSQITDWKSRFYYGWDWMPRIVQTGIWDKVYLHGSAKNTASLGQLQVIADADRNKDIGSLSIKALPNNLALKGNVKIELTGANGKKVLEETLPASDLSTAKIWQKLDVKRWYPNGLGEQPLYDLQLTLLDENGTLSQQQKLRIGFRHLEWHPCKGAAAEADPWICSVNNRSFFIQGINWTPIRPNFADLEDADYVKLLTLYKELGINAIRIWGGGFPEKDCLYELCDELGILVWQDFPLSSSGLDNYPPEGEKETYTITQIVKRYVDRLHHHACMMLWCAGNELYEKGDVAPVTDQHVMIASMKDVVVSLDPSRKFVPGSPSGPSIYADFNNFGKGTNWDVHGPWNLPFTAQDKTMRAVQEFWSKSDALMHSEAGVPGAMSVEMMEKYKGEYNVLPGSVANPLWRNVNWWVQWDEYLADNGNPESLHDYVAWSQKRQTEGLCIAVKTAKERFPACGGFFIWMGHDSYPCMVNTSIIDFEGNPKPAAEELSKIWNDNAYLKNNTYGKK